MSSIHIIASQFEEMLNSELLGEKASKEQIKQPNQKDFQIFEQIILKLIESEGGDIKIWNELIQRAHYFKFMTKEIADDILTSDYFQCFILGIQNEEITPTAFDVLTAMIFPGSYFIDDLLEKDIITECEQALRAGSNIDTIISVLKCISSLYSLNQKVSEMLQYYNIPNLILKYIKVNKIDTMTFNQANGEFVESPESQITKQALRTLRKSVKYYAEHIRLYFTLINKCINSLNEDVRNIGLSLAFVYFAYCGENYQNIEISEILNTLFSILELSESNTIIHKSLKFLIQMSACGSIAATFFEEGVVERLFNFLTDGQGWLAEAAASLGDPVNSDPEPVLNSVRNHIEFIPDILKIFSNMSAHIITKPDGSQACLLNEALERNIISFALLILRDGPYESSMSACFVLSQVLLLAEYEYIKSAISDEMFTNSFEFLEDGNSILNWMLIDGYSAFLDKAISRDDGERASAILSGAHDALLEVTTKEDTKNAELAEALLQRLE